MINISDSEKVYEDWRFIQKEQCFYPNKETCFYFNDLLFFSLTMSEIGHQKIHALHYLGTYWVISLCSVPACRGQHGMPLYSSLMYSSFHFSRMHQILNLTPNGIVSPINLQNTNTFINAFSLFNKDVFNTGIKIVVNNMKI